jgi:hypothetical protein
VLQRLVSEYRVEGGSLLDQAAAIQLPPPGQGAGRVLLENVGNGGSNDWAAGVSGLISTAEGEIISVTSGTTEKDSLTTESDQFSLQLNSQHFTTPLCNGGNAGCYGWQQFVFSNQGGMGLSSQALAFIQYWLVNWGTTPCPGGCGSSRDLIA